MLQGVAAVLDAVGQPVRLADVHVHAPPPGHVLVRMVAARVGEADRATWSGVFSGRLPLVLGAEGAGVVEALGPGTEGRVVRGDHVLVTDERAYVPARGGACAAFRPLGTYATYACVPARRLLRVDASVPLRRVAQAGGATLAGYAAGVRACDRAAGGMLLILGLGEVGQGALAAALTGPAAHVVAVDRRPARLNWAARLGAQAIAADRPDLARAVRAAAGGRGADAAVVTGDTGGPCARASGLLRPGATVAHAVRVRLGVGRAGGQASDLDAARDLEALADRFARDRLATGALCGPDGELEDLSDLLAAGERAGTAAALVELSFDMP